MKNIRNFCIVAHIDHGKSTLADRMLEITNTIEKRKMHDRVLDDMELEQEKGITIKMRPVRMDYTPTGKTKADLEKEIGAPEYILNLIDTPGHIDFFYEVSRALKAVEGCILLVDATQGVQAQTLTTLEMARNSGLTIIPVLSKVDSPLARIADIKDEVMKLLKCSADEILETSGKTGQGVEKLLQEIVRKVPPPHEEFENSQSFRSLVFDFQYSNHKGVIVFIRCFDGMVAKNTPLLFKIADEKFTALEVGTFNPIETPCENLSAGEIGYIVTGIKKPGIASVGDTVTAFRTPLPELPGYMSPAPVVWASIYPESQDDFDLFRQALGRLRLSDSSFTFEEESSGSLGRGFRCGFLGLLHLEIITERLKREFRLNLIIATPSITYEVTYKNGQKKIIYSPSLFPDLHEVVEILEPWVKVKIISPSEYLGAIMPMLYEHEAEAGETETFGHDSGGDTRTALTIKMPLRELMRNFFDELKSVSSGFASLSYDYDGMRKADVCRLDILVADEPVVAFAKVVSVRRVQEDAEKAVEKLANILPQQMFVTKIQGRGLGRIIASKTLSAMRKDVTQHMYGGDITRKMKLREKQKKGKKKMAERGRGNVNIPHETFLKMMKSGE